MTNNGKILAFPDRTALDAEAAAWVARFDAGEVSAKDQAAFQVWLNQSALHREAIAEYGNFWSEFDQLGQLTHSLGAGREPQAKRAHPFSGAKVWLAAAAASVIVMAAAGVFLRQQVPDRPQVAVRQHVPDRPSGPQSYRTAIGAQKKFTLADGSVVTLNTNSQMDVELLGDRRDVHLVRGEAYFDVMHDKTRPFTVYANHYVVRDIGTAFAVHLLDKGLVNVRVTKGSVEIAAPASEASDKAKSLGVIGAGQDIVFGQKIERAEAVSEAELGRKLAWRQGQLIYSGQPLADVLADISRYSDIQIELADPGLRNLPVGGAFSVNQTDAIFAALENNFGIHAEWLDAHHVRLTSVGDKDSSGK
jgi:transmembrane sensor